MNSNGRVKIDLPMWTWALIMAIIIGLSGFIPGMYVASVAAAEVKIQMNPHITMAIKRFTEFETDLNNQKQLITNNDKQIAVMQSQFESMAEDIKELKTYGGTHEMLLKQILENLPGR